MSEEQSVRNLTGEPHGLIYRPPNYEEPIAQKATLGVKFANNTFIHQSVFEKFCIKVPDDVELDNSFMGLGLYKLDDKGNISEKWTKYVSNTSANHENSHSQDKPSDSD